MSSSLEPTRDIAASLVGVGGRSLHVVTVVGGKLRRFEVPAGSKIVLGRSDEADIPLEAPGLSRLHARLSLEDPLRVQDLGSRNGTRIDGNPLQGTGWHTFRLGQPIELGDVLVIVQDRSATGSAQDLSIVESHGSEATRRTENLLDDKKTLRLYEVAERLAQGGLPVLITGESGAGKEHLARFIHEQSAQSRGRLVTVDCASISAERFTEELFGREGPRGPLPGLLRAADLGTLLLDSVDRLPLELQSRLSRAVETGRYVPVGATREEHSRFRVIATSRIDLESEAATGRFQTELFYRICGVHLRVPSLRECKEGVESLVESMRAQIKESDGEELALQSDALRRLAGHDWPGNVRELKLTLRRLAALFADQPVDAQAVAANFKAHAPKAGTERQSQAPTPRADLTVDLENLERRRILSALEANDGNQTKTAKALGISRKVLMRRLDLYKIPRPRKNAKPET